MAAKMHIDRDFFYNSVRGSVFGGQLTKSQVANMDEILSAIEASGITNPYWIGAALATVRIEVGPAMAPVREGFAKTDGGARKHVASLYRAGLIKKNYALPDPETGKSYYGRGYPQTTHKENYRKTGEALGVGDDYVNEPDLLLDPYVASRGMIEMMRIGGYRKGKSFASTLGTWPEVPTESMIYNSRDIINGDKNKRRGKSKTTIGAEYAALVKKFAAAIKVYYDAPVVEGGATTGNGTPIKTIDELPAPKPGFWQRILNWFTDVPN
jgi:hypothetical protein